VVRPCSRLTIKEPVSRHGRAHVAGRRPSGAGTSRLGRRLATILPAMTLARPSRPSACIASRASPAYTALVTARPFRAPPQTISDVGLMGGRGKHTFYAEWHSPPSPHHSWSPRPGALEELDTARWLRYLHRTPPVLVWPTAAPCTLGPADHPVRRGPSELARPASWLHRG
jgi:hypothetical protein